MSFYIKKALLMSSKDLTTNIVMFILNKFMDEEVHTNKMKTNKCRQVPKGVIFLWITTNLF